MRRQGTRKRRFLLLAAAMAILLSGSAGLLWVKTHRSPGLLEEATAAYSHGEFGRAASLSSRILKEARADPQAIRLAARAAARQDQDQKSLALYHRLAKEKLTAEDLCLVGRALTRTGNTAPAFDAYEAARQSDPDYPDALAALAALYMRTDRYHAAAEAAERLTRQPHWEARAQLLLGTIRSETQDPLGAARALARWLQLDPHGQAVGPLPLAPLQKRLARSWLQAGQPAEARAVLNTLTAAEPDHEVMWLLSRCSIQEKNWKQAALLLKQSPSYRLEHPAEFEPASYVGERRCAACHREQHEAVIASRHASTFIRGCDLRDFPLPEGPVVDPGNPEVTHELRHERDSLAIETRINGRALRAIVDYAFGSRDHFTTFVGHDGKGQSFMVRMSYFRSSRGTGWDVATGLPTRPADPEEYLGKKMAKSDGLRRCLNCHTTNQYSVVHDDGPEAADRSVGCEGCHGPGGNHVAAVGADFADLAIAGPQQAPPAAIDPICAKCHGTQEPEGVDLPRTDPVWRRFQSLTLSWSRCYNESGGKLGCVTCHDPHRNAQTVPADNDAKCLVCHSAAKPNGPATKPAANRHPGRPLKSSGDDLSASTKTVCPISPARGCTECHMPRIWTQSTHSFQTDHFIRIPDRLSQEGRAKAVQN
jgi:cytochrome c-type biogenesis protein CcmH/NrfG